MAAPGTFAELRTEISSWLNRTDLTTAQLSTLVNMAEADIRSKVKLRRDVTLATGTLSGESLTLPATFLEARRFETGGKVRSYLEPQQYQRLKDSGISSGYFTILGANLLSLGSVNGDAYSLLYVAAPTPLSADGDTNWLLQNYPQVYLYAALKHGGVYFKDPQAAQGYDVLWQQAVADLNAAEARGNQGGQMVIRPDTVE